MTVKQDTPNDKLECTVMLETDLGYNRMSKEEIGRIKSKVREVKFKIPEDSRVKLKFTFAYKPAGARRTERVDFSCFYVYPEKTEASMWNYGCAFKML